MTTCSLTLIPYGKQPFTINLLESDGRQKDVERIIEHASGEKSIFSDLSYEMTLDYDDLPSIQDVSVYINDTYEPSTFANGRICFPLRGTSDRRIFLDCFGFVEISISITATDGSVKNLTSDYLPVLVRRGELNESVKAMVNYVYQHQEALLMNGEPKPRNLAGLKESGYRSLAAQIILAEEIAAIYESSYGYFKTNSRFQIEKTATVDRLDKLQSITPATLQYISTHPEQLRSVNSSYGIRLGSRVFHPEKALSLQNVNSYDIYENRVVLGFLRKMIDEIVGLRERCRELLQQIPDDEDYSPEYIFSSFFMFAETRRMLGAGIQTLTVLYDKFVQLWSLYQSALEIPVDILTDKPAPSAIFMSVPQYNKIFVRIHQWFSYGIYDFAKENFMLSFVKISSLYESYLLSKLITYFMDRGYTLTNAKRCVYPVSRRWKYKNTNCSNTFCFTQERIRITLYYQPVIFDTDQSHINGIGLYRNNSIPSYTGEDDDNRQGGHYYVPDYLIKVETENAIKYLIIDAKFSDFSSVRRHYIKDLAFKYLFSISPIHENELISGMCIMYGKCTSREDMQSAYDKKLPERQISPTTDIIPIIEGIAAESQYEKIDSLLKKIIS